MIRLMLVSAAFGLLLAGCADEADSRPKLSSRTFVWEAEERPYEMIAVGGSNVPDIGDQTRTAQAIYAEPDDRAAVAKALDEIYGELKSDVEDTQADARYRRITVSIYDTKGDVEHDPNAWLCSVTVDPKSGEPLPDDLTDVARWQWRDPAGRPTAVERQMEWDYRDALMAADRSVEFGVTEDRLSGLSAVERMAVYAQEYPDESAAALEKLATRHNMTAEQVRDVVDRVVAWKYQTEAIDKAEPADVPASATEPADAPPTNSNDGQP